MKVVYNMLKSMEYLYFDQEVEAMLEKEKQFEAEIMTRGKSERNIHAQFLEKRNEVIKELEMTSLRNIEEEKSTNIVDEKSDLKSLIDDE